MQGHVRRSRLVPQWTELIEYELHADTDELDELGIRALVGFRALLAVHRHASDLGQILHDLAEIPWHAALVLDDTRPEPVQKALAPLGQRRGAGIDGLLIGGQEQLELHLGTLQGSRRVSE